MNLKETLSSEINEKIIKQRILAEGQMVLQVISHPGWSLIEGALLGAKIKAENLRKKELSKKTAGESALYYSGVVDGVEEAKQVIYNVVKEAERVRDNKGEENED